MKISKLSNKNFCNNESNNFIPIACHYDENTLLTKNGELLQTIKISELDSNANYRDLSNLRSLIRRSISSNKNGKKFAFWINTIRKRENLDDNNEYHNILTANIHDLWYKKNNWYDKFINNIYVTIIYYSSELKIKNFRSWLNSLSFKTIANFETKYFAAVKQEIDQMSDSILQALQQYGAKKLSIYFEQEEPYSDLILLYQRIIQLNEYKSVVPISDISSSLALDQYSVSSNKMEISHHDNKKFVASLSLKEYREDFSDGMDKFLQMPVEMIATEIFYFVQPHEVISKFKEQDYILKVSKDPELKHLKGLDTILDHDNSHFCHRQLFVTIVGDKLDQLESNVIQASEQLSKLGIMHVREDIDLEKIFWSQLPANFSFLSRINPTILKNTAAFASLSNSVIGNKSNIWGNALTLLKAENGSPYFLNFHDKTNIGTSCIFGKKNSGKTTLLNFLISEADKYQPTTLYLTNNEDSNLYINARSGAWFQQNKYIVNPLLCENTPENKQFLLIFFKIIANHYFDPLNKEELSILEILQDSVFEHSYENRGLAEIITLFSNSYQEKAKSLLQRLSVYLPGGDHYGIFEGKTPIQLPEGNIVAINLQDFDDDHYTKSHYPQDEALLEEFLYKKNVMGSVRTAIILAMQNSMNNSSDEPKLFVIDDLLEMINVEYYSELLPLISDNMQKINGVFVTTINSESLAELGKNHIAKEWIRNLNTNFILPSESSITKLDKIIGFNKLELTKLNQLSSSSSRKFLIKQDNDFIVSQLDIDDLPGLARLLSSTNTEYEIYQKLIKGSGNKKPEDWLGPLYEELTNTA